MKRICAIIILILISFSVGGCNINDKEYIYFSTVEYFNTDFSIRVFANRGRDEGKLSRIFDQMKLLAAKVENLLSVEKTESDIYNYNSAAVGARIKIDPLTATVLQKAVETYCLTDGAYNPATMMSADLWGFSPRFYNGAEGAQPYDRPKINGQYVDLPQDEYAQAFRALCDFDGFEVEQVDGEYFITKICPAVCVDGKTYTQALDLGGIAKGYLADECAKILAQNGFDCGMVSVGESSLFLQEFFDTDIMKKRDWKISIASPKNRLPLFYFNDRNCGVSTSGSYEKNYSLNGKTYGHIIDGSTGAPADNEIISVTLSGIDAMMGDALTTAMCVMGIDKAIEFAMTINCKTVILVSDGDKFIAYTNIDRDEYSYEKSQISQVRFFK